MNIRSDDRRDMEFVATTTQQLETLAQHDARLRPYFAGVFASDALPSSPSKAHPRGYIVNVDRREEQGSHWLGVWTEDETCEIMDSFGMDVTRYDIPWFEKWTRDHFWAVRESRKTLQAIDSQSCGMYALAFLIVRATGISMDGFLSMFTTHDYVKNDHRIAQWFKKTVKDTLVWERMKREQPALFQGNTVPVRLLDMRAMWRSLSEEECGDTVF